MLAILPATNNMTFIRPKELRNAALSIPRAMQIFQVLRVGSVLLTSILLAKSRLTMGEIGVYETLLYLGTVAAFFWVNGLLQGLTPVYARLEESGRKKFIFNTFLVFCAIAAGLFLLLLLGKNLALPLLTGREEVPFFTLFCGYLLFNLPTLTVEYYHLLNNRAQRIVTWGTVTFSVQIAALFLPVQLGWGLEGGLFVLFVLAVMKWFWALGVVLRYGETTLDPGLIRHYLIFSWPLILNTLVANLTPLFDNWLVGWWYHDDATFALFRYGSRELPLATALATALGTAMIPRLVAEPDKGLEELKTRSRRMFHLLFPLTIVLLFFSEKIFPLVFNPGFIASAALFNIYLLRTASRVLLPNSVVLARGAARAILWVSVAEFALKIVLSLVFIRYWGLAGVGWSAVLAFWVEKLGLIWYLESRLDIRTRDWLDWRWYLGYTALMFGAYFWVNFSL